MHIDDEIKKIFQTAGPIYPEIDLEGPIMEKVQVSAQRKGAFLRYQRFGKLSLIGFLLLSVLFFLMDHSHLKSSASPALISAVFIIFSLLLIQLELFQKNKKTIFSN